MTTKFLVADNDPKGLLLSGESLQKEFSCSLEYVHKENDLHQKISQTENCILFYDLAFSQDANCIDSITYIQEKFQHITILPLVPTQYTDKIKELLSHQLFFYLVKPLETAEITLTVRRALEAISLQQPQESDLPNDNATNTSGDFQGMIGNSKPMSHLFDIIERIANDDFSTVLIRGESGTGKEMVAKAIHQKSKRSKYNFVPVNCAAIPDELLESELFGYTKGAFTGATSNKQGRIQYADKGILFLDEIGDMKPSLQAKLLRVLQEREFEPVGGFKTTPVDTRVLAATHCNLEKLVEQGLFREDLYYRLSVIPLTIPPLRERKNDIAPLITLFIEQYTHLRGRASFSFSKEAMQALLAHDWKGNVRELENLIQHMAVLYSGTIVQHNNLPIKFQLHQQPTSTLTAQPLQANNWSHPEISELASAFARSPSKTPTKSSSSNFPTEEPHPSELFSFNESPEIGLANNLSAPSNIETEISTAPHQEHQQQAVDHWGEGKVDFKNLVDKFENQLIIQALHLAKGNKKKAAELLNLKRTTLLEKIKKKGLQDSWS